MKKQIKKEIAIKATKEKVWKVLLEDKTYRIWTSPFCEGSYAVAKDNWKEGSKVLFLSPENSGLVSEVVTNKPGEEISFKHLGLVEKGKENYDNPEIINWSGFRETYRLFEKNGETILVIEQDMNEKEQPVFEKMWDEALKKVKELSESKELL